MLPLIPGAGSYPTPTPLSPRRAAGCNPIRALAHQLLPSYIGALCDNRHGHAETSAILAAEMVGFSRLI